VFAAIREPNAGICAIDVSFATLKNMVEFDFLNRQPTSFLLRAATGRLIAEPPDLQWLLREAGVKIVPDAARP
jgi:hypothetical protein